MGNPGIIFVAVAVIFVAASLRDLLRDEGKLSLARRTWLRVAFIFAGVGAAIQVLPMLLP
jgi:hypothetical protein